MWSVRHFFRQVKRDLEIFSCFGKSREQQNARRTILRMTSNPAEISRFTLICIITRIMEYGIRNRRAVVQHNCLHRRCVSHCTTPGQHTHTIPLSPPPSSPSHRNRCGPKPVMIPGLILGVAGSSKGICSKGDLRLSRSQQRQPLYIHILRRAAAIHLFGARAACRRPPTQRKVLCSEQPKLSLLPPRNICG